jgi:hypothetical protein
MKKTIVLRNMLLLPMLMKIVIPTALLLVVGILAPACNQQQSQSTNRAASDTTLASRNPKPLPRPLPSNVVDLFPKWFAVWRMAGVTLAPDSFSLGITEKIPTSTLYTLELESEAFRQWKPFRVSSPDSLKAVDPYTTHELMLENGRLKSGGRDIDVAVTVVDLRTGKAFVPLTCGTPCDYHDAAWVDERTFVVVGTSYLLPGEGENRGTTEVIEPTIYVVSLEDSSFSVYDAPFVDAETYSRSGISKYVGEKLDKLFTE